MEANTSTKDGHPFVWNPSAAVNWAFLFTPVFGSYLQYRNWVSLSEPQHAQRTLKWFFFSWLILAVQTAGLLSVISTTISLPVALSYYLIEKHSGFYHKRSWFYPLLIAGPIYWLLLGTSNYLYEKNKVKVSMDGIDIRRVKDGAIAACPGQSVDRLVTSFMSEPVWKSGKSESGKDYVTVKGRINYNDKPVTAAIQFITTSDSFSFYAYELNGVPMNALHAAALIVKMCEEATASAVTDTALSSVPTAKVSPVSKQAEATANRPMAIPEVVSVEKIVVGHVQPAEGGKLKLSSMDDGIEYAFDPKSEVGIKILEACTDLPQAVYCAVEGKFSQDSIVAVSDVADIYRD